MASVASPVRWTWRDPKFLMLLPDKWTLARLSWPTHITNQCFGHPALMQKRSAGSLGPRMLLPPVKSNHFSACLRPGETVSHRDFEHELGRPEFKTVLVASCLILGHILHWCVWGIQFHYL